MHYLEFPNLYLEFQITINDNCVRWDSLHENSELQNWFLNLVKQNNLFQIIDEITHLSDSEGTLLDLVITDSPAYNLDSGIDFPLGDPYHCLVYCKFQFNYNKENTYKRHIWNYDRCNFE